MKKKINSKNDLSLENLAMLDFYLFIASDRESYIDYAEDFKDFSKEMYNLVSENKGVSNYLNYINDTPIKRGWEFEDEEVYLYSLNSGFLSFGKKIKGKDYLMYDIEMQDVKLSLSIKDAITFDIELEEGVFNLSGFQNNPNLFYSASLDMFFEIKDGKYCHYNNKFKVLKREI